ncbi:hypothetical protein EB001_17630, partial [bacterium]|nr:hypothetical protein [bacterium]
QKIIVNRGNCSPYKYMMKNSELLNVGPVTIKFGELLILEYYKCDIIELNLSDQDGSYTYNW